MTHRKASIIQVDVDNPMRMPDHPTSRTNPRKTVANLNINESPITRMYYRGQIGEAEFAAAAKYRKIYERLTGRMDKTLKERVDCSGFSDPGIANIDASKAYQEASRALGPVKGRILDSVCGQGTSLSKTAGIMKMRKAGVLEKFREGLGILSDLWGFAN